MECEIDGKIFVFSRKVRNDSVRRRSFDALAQQTFGLSFEAWRRGGYWGKNTSRMCCRTGKQS